ncbi:MAG: hypothetical protein R3F46_09660 [bacterium]
MMARLFRWTTGVPWDEFLIGWRIYNAHHRTAIRRLAFWSVLGMLMLCLPASFFRFASIDVSGFIFPAQQSGTSFMANSYSSPLFIAAALIPLVAMFMPTKVEETLPGLGDSIRLSARLSSLGLQAGLAGIFVVGLAMLESRSNWKPWLFSASEFRSTFPVELLAILLILVTLQRFHPFTGRVSSWWMISYSVWLPSYLLLRNAVWDRPFMFWDITGWDYSQIHWVGSITPLLYFAMPIGLLFAMIRPMVARIMLPIMCLSSVFCAFFLSQHTEWLMKYAFFHILSLVGWILIGVPGGGYLDCVGLEQ